MSKSALKIFSSEILALDFALIARKPVLEAADALRGILRDCEAVQEQVETAQTRLFNVLMCAARVATEMEIYRLEDNPETGFPFTNVEDWIAFHCPKCAGYAQKANRIQASLPKVTLPQLESMKECNGELLGQYVSSEKLKSDPAVIEAASTMTEKSFRKLLNDNGQMIEKPCKLFKSFPESKAESIREALAIVAKEVSEHGGPELETLEDQLWYWAVDYVAEHQEVPA
jgi:hypothetical protein